MLKLFKNKNTEFKVGLFILIPVIIILMIILVKLGYSVASSTMDIYLKVDSMKSIKKGTPVQMKGYTLGRISSIVPVYKPDLHFLAVMRIDRNFRIDENCTAVIMNQNIIGDPVIKIKNPEKISKLIKAGDVIEGFEVVSLDSLVTNINSLISNLKLTVSEFSNLSSDNRYSLKKTINNLKDGIGSLSKVLKNSEGDLIATFGNLRKMSKNLKDISKELKKHPVKFLFQDKQ